jgi:hypothetical protein
MSDKDWTVKYKKLPNEEVFTMITVEKTEEKARQLSLLGLALSTYKNSAVEKIEIVSCEERVKTNG